MQVISKLIYPTQLNQGRNSLPLKRGDHAKDRSTLIVYLSEKFSTN